MALNLAGYRSFFNNTVYTVVEKMEGMMNDPIFNIAGERPHNKGSGDTVSFTSETLDGYGQRVPAGGEIPETNVVEGDTLSKVFVSYKDQMKVEYETFLFNKLDLVLERAEALAERTNNIIALELTHQLFNSADSSTLSLKGGGSASITTADGQPLASASHTVAGTGSTTYSNILSGGGALSEANLSALIQQGKQNNVSDAGTNLSFSPDCIIVPDNELMIRKALELTKSTLVPESNNNAVNVYSGGAMDVIVLKQSPRDSIGNYTTGHQYRWAVANKKQLKRAVKYTWALKPTEVGAGLIPNFRESNLDSRISVASNFVFGAPRWQGIYYSLSTTAPTIGSAA